MTTPHKHAEVLRAIADGQQKFQRRGFDASGDWVDIPMNAVLSTIANYPDKCELRVAPDTIKIGKREVERPSGRGPDGRWFQVAIDAGEMGGAEYYKVFDFQTEKACRAFYDALAEVAGGES